MPVHIESRLRKHRNLSYEQNNSKQWKPQDCTHRVSMSECAKVHFMAIQQHRPQFSWLLSLDGAAAASLLALDLWRGLQKQLKEEPMICLEESVINDKAIHRCCKQISLTIQAHWANSVQHLNLDQSHYCALYDLLLNGTILTINRAQH